MAVPKRKMSRSNTRSRRSQWLRIDKPTYAACKRCKQPLRPHTVCANCGTYAGRDVLEVEE